MSAIGASAGYPTLKFANPGDSHWGVIVGVRDVQATDFVTRKPKFYPDGNPVLQTVITIQDPQGEFRRIFVTAGAMRSACANAVSAVGASDVEPGGKIKLTYTGQEPATNGGTRKAFKAQYKKPDPGWVAPDMPSPVQRQTSVVETVAYDSDGEEAFDPYPDEPPF